MSTGTHRATARGRKKPYNQEKDKKKGVQGKELGKICGLKCWKARVLLFIGKKKKTPLKERGETLWQRSTGKKTGRVAGLWRRGT